MSKKNAITPTREENYPEWYQQVIKAADLAEHSVVRGCMVIKPWGYAIWENIQKVLDRMSKETGHENAYFPLFIPLSFLEKEAEHVEGFAKECAVITHHRLEKGPDGKLTPAGELEEPLVVRPTSEMIIGESFSRWIQSYRDLPLLINQWANVVRWEMRTRLFLRTTEFLWQEGHTVHETKEEAEAHTLKMLEVYVRLAEDYLAMPVVAGIKTADERFPGAVETYTIEIMMQDRKALQAGTSHFLGQNFSKSCEIQFQTREGNLEYGWTTSWGLSTRMIGAMIMTHSDDDGLILPPKIASKQIVLIPVIFSDDQKVEVLQYCEKFKKELESIVFNGESLGVIIDDREGRAGEKTWHWIKKGIPLRIEIGPREIKEGKISVTRRDKGPKERVFFKQSEFLQKVISILEEIQKNLFNRAKKFQKENTHEIKGRDEFFEFFTPKDTNNPEIHGGFALCHYSEETDVHELLQKELNVTARCIPLELSHEEGSCVISGKPSKRKVIFAKAY